MQSKRVCRNKKQIWLQVSEWSEIEFSENNRKYNKIRKFIKSLFYKLREI